jgi:N-acetyl-beta-hexosaminidase
MEKKLTLRSQANGSTLAAPPTRNSIPSPITAARARTGGKLLPPSGPDRNPLTAFRLIYSFSPTQFLTEEQAKLVLGGEIHIWSEQIDSQSLDVMLWPRGSAAAEVLWSGRTDANGNNRTFADATPRLAEFRERMVARGVRATPVTQLWCLSHPGDCALNS